jgi:transcriptional regulator with XRE-family HTH domain
MDIGKKIKSIREHKGLTAKEVISAVDMGAPMYSRIENGVSSRCSPKSILARRVVLFC